MAAPTSLLWQGLTLGSGTRYRIKSVEGWDELPPVRYDKQDRARAHGTYPSPVWADERTVTVEGWCWTEVDRDSLLRDLRRVMVPSDDVDDLTVTMAGLTLTAGAQPVKFAPILKSGEWGTGRFGWIAVWRCPDPRRYSPTVTVGPAGLPLDTGGLDFGPADGSGGVDFGPADASGGVDFGAAGDSGRLTVVNGGDADVGLLVRVNGPLLDGWEVTALETGDRLRFEHAVQAGQWVAVDTAEGTVLLNGTADYRPYLTVAQWPTVPPGQTRTLQLAALGPYDPGASMLVDVADGYW